MKSEIVFVGKLKIKYRIKLILFSFKVLFNALRGYDISILTKHE